MPRKEKWGSSTPSESGNSIRDFWADKNCPLESGIDFRLDRHQEAGRPERQIRRSALAGADIQTNPPSTNEAIQQLEGATYTRQVDQLPADRGPGLKSMRRSTSPKLEEVLMQEGLQKFADPQKGLLALIGDKRKELAGA